MIRNKISCAGPIKPNKKISVFLVTGLKILDRVCIQCFLIYFFSEKGISPFKMPQIIYFSKKFGLSILRVKNGDLFQSMEKIRQLILLFFVCQL